jgi:multidrug efflux system outer membrane protein
MKRFSFSLPLVALLMSGCATSPPREVPDVGFDIPASWTTAATNGEVEDGWIFSFNDPRLRDLVMEAIRYNPDLEAAEARLRQAYAVARGEGAPAWPSLSYGLDAGRRQTVSRVRGGGPTTFENFLRSRSSSAGLSFDIIWELDVWGRIRSAQAGALADADAAADAYQDAQFSLAAQTAKSWFSTAEAYLQYQLALETERSFRDTASLTEGRYQRGLVSAADVHLTRASAASASANVQATKQTFHANVRALEILLGRYPSTELDVLMELPPVPAPIPAGIPSDILRRRPDLRSAERDLAGALQRTEAARADFFPRISLTASGGTSSDALHDIIDPRHIVWNILLNLTGPLLDGAQRAATLDLRKAQVVEASANFKRAALDAFAEVENFLDAETLLAAREEAAEEAANQAEKAYRRTEAEYTRGLTDITAVLQAQRDYLNNRREFLTVKRSRLTNRVDLHLALGGNFRNLNSGNRSAATALPTTLPGGLDDNE